MKAAVARSCSDDSRCFDGSGISLKYLDFVPDPRPALGHAGRRRRDRSIPGKRGVIRYLAATLVLYLTVAGCSGPNRPSDAELKRAASALPAVLPAVFQAHVDSYLERDHCRSLKFGLRAFSTDPETPTCNLFSERPQPFNAEADAAFDRIRAALADSGVNVIGVNTYDLGNDGRPGAERVTFDVANPWNARWSYVYEPGYTLPESDPVELVATRIDSSWYFLWQDSN